MLRVRARAVKLNVFACSTHKIGKVSVEGGEKLESGADSERDRLKRRRELMDVEEVCIE